MKSPDADDCALPVENKLPYGFFMPRIFTYAGISGVSDTWGTFGKWVADIGTGLDKLPEDEIKKVREMTADKQSDVEKVRVLYRYLQKNTRYVSVIVGPGGYKTHSAQYVCSNKFGDCKALNNYMRSMLEVAGITSYYTLVNAGAEEQDTDTSFVFPSFNHVIQYVPLKTDTIWLECTSSLLPFNYLGTFTSGKHALVIDGEKSYLKKTPGYGSDKNYTHSVLRVSINPDQTYTVSLSKKYSGYNSEQVSYMAKTLASEKQQEWLIKSLPFGDIKVNSLDFHWDDNQPLVNENMVFSCRKTIGKTPVFAAMIKFPGSCTSVKRDRTSDIYVPYGYEFSDSSSFAFPVEYKIQALPPSREISGLFGTYTKKVTVEKNNVLIYRRLIRNPGTFSNKHIGEYNEFIKSINQFENEEIIYSANSEK